jgi:hypothetical protein
MALSVEIVVQAQDISYYEFFNLGAIVTQINCQVNPSTNPVWTFPRKLNFFYISNSDEFD